VTSIGADSVSKRRAKRTSARSPPFLTPSTMAWTRRSKARSSPPAGVSSRSIARRLVEGMIFSTTSQHDLVQGVFDDALRAGAFQPRNQVAHGALLDDRVHRHPLLVAQGRDRRPLQRRQQ